jgi:nucleoside-diphosphate-sugar epimerase
MGSVDRNVALVFGASGISGWAVTNNLLSYPAATTFSRIIGLTNRPMDKENSQLPIDDPRLEIYDGVDLRGDQASVMQQMRAIIPNVDEVTHVYYCGQSSSFGGFIPPNRPSPQQCN